MSASGADPRRVAVLDVGKTNVKVVLFDGASGTEAWARTMPNTVLRDGPYPHFDVPRIEAFFVDALADLAREGGFDAVSITAHGAAGALIGADRLALPILDYEHEGPDALSEAYGRVRPGFDETCSPRLPGGLNLGAQLFWQSQAFPEAFEAARAFVTYPQYWAYWLTGVVATEPTSLGAHTDLWDPRGRCFSSLVAAMGWTGKMAPVHSAFDRLGPIRADLAKRIGLDRAIPVACGIHDSNASLLPHLQANTGAFSVISTGTWAIAFALDGALERLDPARDTLANVDAYGRPIPSARFMGGREFDILTNRDAGDIVPEAVRSVIARQVMALPTFAPGSGPFPHGRGQWTHDPTVLSRAERTVAASLYVALMTASCLELLAASGRTIIEGPFARNALYCSALAHLSGREVLAALGSTGTSAGATHLVLADAGPKRQNATTYRSFGLGEDLDTYAASWQRACVVPAT